MDTIAYLVYGTNRDYQLELTYSVLSARQQLDQDAADCRILLICDERSRRDDLPVKCHVVDPAMFAAWTRHGSYNHESKIHALRLALQLSDGKVALVDTDTYFIASPASLFERVGDGKALMHSSEGVVGQYSYWAPILEAKRDWPQKYAVEPGSRMLNSGVVGIDQSHAPLLDDVRDLCSQLYGVEPVFNVEQFAFTAVLDRHTRLATCDDLVVHYWGGRRRFMHAAIAKSFPEFSETLFERNASLQIHAGFPRKCWIDQAHARIRQMVDGCDNEVQFAHLCSLSALRMHRRDPLLANAWSLTALDFLRLSEAPRRGWQTRFAAMNPDLAQSAWMDAKTARAWSSYWGMPQ